MGAADKEVAGAERTDNLRRARDERHHTFGLSIGHVVQFRPIAVPLKKRTLASVSRGLAAVKNLTCAYFTKLPTR